MFQNFINQFLFLFIGVAVYFGGGLVAAMADYELKAGKKYVLALLKILIAFVVGFLVFETLGLLYGLIAGILVVVILLLLKKFDLFYFVAIIGACSIILNDLLLINFALTAFLLQGIFDYTEFLYKEKKTKKKESKNLKMLFRALQILILAGILIVLFYFVM